MKTNCLVLSIIIVALFMVSCIKENRSSSSLASEYVRVDAYMGDLARTIVTTFENGDAISVYAWTGKDTEVSSLLVVNNSINTYNGTLWIPTSPMLWQDWTTKHYFIGVYPQRTITDFITDSYPFTIDDQSASNLLIATNTKGIVATQGVSVPLVFTHAMAKLTINLVFDTEWSIPPTVSDVIVNAVTSGTVNYLNKIVTPTGVARDISIPVTVANTTYSSVMFPQLIANDITIVIDGKDYVYALDTPLVLISSKNQIVNLNVGSDKLILLNSSIADWKIGTGESIIVN